MNVKTTGAQQLGLRLSALKGTPKAILQAWQLETTRLAKRKARKKTGNLQRSIGPGSLGSMSAKVGASASYAAIIEFGSKPHVIVPRYAKVLAWGGARRLTGSLRSGSKATNFAMRVNHPGTKAYPFLYPAAAEAMVSEDVTGQIVGKWNEAA